MAIELTIEDIMIKRGLSTPVNRGADFVDDLNTRYLAKLAGYSPKMRNMMRAMHGIAPAQWSRDRSDEQWEAGR